jgi:hypothetical protein
LQLEPHFAVERATHLGIFDRDVWPVLGRSHGP